jgi:hypothetical protein
MNARIPLLLAAFAGLVSSASAQVITGLVNTGVGAVGAADADYALISVPGGGAGTAYATLPHDLWMANSVTSKWIGPSPDSANVRTDAAGDYVYELTFDVAGYDLGALAINGQWLTDNEALMYLNGTLVDSIPFGYPAFQQWNAFTLTGLQASNVLQFKVNNGVGSSGNPSGLRVEFTQVIPEPEFYAFAMVGFVAVIVGIRRFRQRSLAAPAV